MNNYYDALGLALTAHSEVGQRRERVLKAVPWSPTPTTRVSYIAANRVLIIASEEKALEIESRLPPKMATFLAILSDESGLSLISNGWRVEQLTLEGYLGKFSAVEGAGDKEAVNLGGMFNIDGGYFDHVIDDSDEPLIRAAIKPPGYYYIDNDDDLDDALEAIPEYIGEFEKPKFFEYDASICAHGRSGVPGCRRCIDACPTEAIISIGEQVEVNPYLCQGGGSCASSCPSGAIRYVYPPANEQIELIRQIVRAFRMDGQEGHHQEEPGLSLIVFDHEHGLEAIENQIDQLAESMIPVAVEEIGSIGIDFLSSALAYGVGELVLFVPDSVPSQVKKVLIDNQQMVESVIAQTGQPHSIKMINELTGLVETGAIASLNGATFGAAGNKRGIVRTALGHLNQTAAQPKEVVSLPPGSMFGQLNLEQQACTLCMGCVSVCPGNALAAGGESPALRFIEANCLQCGVCEKACPESAISLEPRLHFDVNVVNALRTLKEEEPFLCISCHKPFATKGMIDKMTEKLRGHWMFDNPKSLKRLQMCEDCRVVDMFDEKDMIG